MNIDLLLTTNLAKAWRLFKDRLKRCQLRAIQAQPYDVATGTAGSTVTATAIDALMFDPDLSLMGEGTDIQVTDKRAILLTQHLPDVTGRKPVEGRVQVGDRLIDHNGQDWAVILVRGETDFFFDLTIRR